MLINKEQVPRLDSIFDKIPDLNKKQEETQEQIQQRVQSCGAELQALMQEQNCAFHIIPGLFIDNESKLRVNPQIGVRYVEN